MQELFNDDNVDESLKSMIDDDDYDDELIDSDDDIDSIDEFNNSVSVTINTVDVNNVHCDSQHKTLQQNENSLDVFVESEFENEEDDKQLNKAWEYKQGNAHNETESEYNIFKTYLRLGSGRSFPYILKLFNLRKGTLSRICTNNNWKYRTKLYDLETLAIEHRDIDKEAMQLHQNKLNQYRQQQEFIARLASDAAARLLVINTKRIDKLMTSDEIVTIDELIGLSGVAQRMANLGKELGSQALGVDALLEAMEDIED
jgi:hypothetical protein